ncbi:MAG TPA: hypothetical protein VMV32_07605 [Ignavibacteriaceae bacterium]|nr:hypothetical protein [Ignavibacteriaceae bacterium]
MIQIVTFVSMLPKDLYKTLIDKNANPATNDDNLWTDFISIIEMWNTVSQLKT